MKGENLDYFMDAAHENFKDVNEFIKKLKLDQKTENENYFIVGFARGVEWLSARINIKSK